MTTPNLILPCKQVKQIKTINLKLFCCSNSIKTMKKIIQSVLILLLSITAIEGFAHAYCLNRSNCLSSVLQRRYVAVARTYNNNYTGINWSRKGTCSGAVYAYSTKNRFGNQCANQSADNNSGAWNFTGWNNSNCSRGYEFSDMYNTLTSRGTYTASSDESTCNISTTGQSLNSNTVTITAIRGSMLATANMISSFSVKVWLPANEKDTTIDNSELLYNGTIVIRYGQVELLGNFATDFTGKYTMTKSGSRIKVDYNGSDLVFKVSVPRGRSMSEVSIMGEVDGAPIASGGSLISGKEIGFAQPTALEKLKNGEVSFNVFPNPSKENFNISFKSIDESNLSIKLFDIEGKLVKELLNISIKRNEEINIKTEDLKIDLSAGKYFIVVDDGKEFYTKQIIKE